MKIADFGSYRQTKYNGRTYTKRGKASLMSNYSIKIVKRAFLLAVNSIIHAPPELILLRRDGFRMNRIGSDCFDEGGL